MNSAIETLAPYAFTALSQRKSALQSQGMELFDFGIGDPQDPTPAFIRQSLTDALQPESRYPTAAGLPELRQAIAGWFGRRFSVTLDPDVHVLPANGSKEALFNLGTALLDDPRRGPQAVGVPELAYQVYADSAWLHHAEVIHLPLGSDWLPDLSALTPEVLGRLRLLWLNYPNNPTGAVAPLSYYREALALAERWGFYVASDEAYSELWYDSPPTSLLQAGLGRAIAINTLSKRSNMTAYRSGVIAGDAQVVAALRGVRPRMGVATPEFIQRAAVAAWEDEAHVTAQRRRYAERRALLIDVLERKGLTVDASEATFYLWVRVPEWVEQRSSRQFAEWLLERGIVVLPGEFLGVRGATHVRLALVPPLETCQRAAEILDRVL
ncbi:MAG: succinyldiaminopimelate transaminase [Dehalococcoidia bacterium]|nr:succinyldiaminopimelate transaminase [Dehalococcoidia bacterium]